MTIEKGCCIALTACAALFLLSLVRLSNTINSTLLQVRADAHTEALKLDSTLTDLDRDTVIASGTLTSLQKASKLWSSQQDVIFKQTNSLISSLNLSATQASMSLLAASSLLRSLQSSSESLSDTASASLTKMGDSAAGLATQVQPILLNASEATRIASNGLSESLPDLQATVKSTAATAANVEATTKDVRDFAHRELAPAKGVWNTIKAFLFEIAGPAASVATSIK
jgi:hypothetical protein